MLDIKKIEKDVNSSLVEAYKNGLVFSRNELMVFCIEFYKNYFKEVKIFDTKLREKLAKELFNFLQPKFSPTFELQSEYEQNKELKVEFNLVKNSNIQRYLKKYNDLKNKVGSTHNDSISYYDYFKNSFFLEDKNFNIDQSFEYSIKLFENKKELTMVNVKYVVSGSLSLIQRNKDITQKLSVNFEHEIISFDKLTKKTTVKTISKSNTNVNIDSETFDNIINISCLLPIKTKKHTFYILSIIDAFNLKEDELIESLYSINDLDIAEMIDMHEGNHFEKIIKDLKEQNNLHDIFLIDTKKNKNGTVTISFYIQYDFLEYNKKKVVKTIKFASDKDYITSRYYGFEQLPLSYPANRVTHSNSHLIFLEDNNKKELRLF